MNLIASSSLLVLACLCIMPQSRAFSVLGAPRTWKATSPLFMMEMDEAEVMKILEENPQLQEKALNALEAAGDDIREAALNFGLALYPEEQDKLGVSRFGFERKLQALKPIVLSVRDQTATDDTSTFPGDESYMDVLLTLPSTDRNYREKLMFLTHVQGAGDEKTFFVRTGGVRNLFRHAGVMGAIPPYVYVGVVKRDVDIVHVYNQHSGVGKTVELCCSAYIRSADLAIYHKGRLEDDIKADEIAAELSSTDGEDSFVARQRLAETRIKRIVGETVEWNKNVFLALKQRCGISNTFKLVLAIDEASTCRTLVRAIIRDYGDLGETAAEEFQSLLDWKVDIKVLFSVAGTGSAAADIGTFPDSFTIIEPSVSSDPESVYDALRRGYNVGLPKYEQLKTRRPVLFTFAQYNARFASIVLEVLTKESKASGNTEGFLIRKVVDFFLASNGICAISRKAEELARAGAQTLAVHLFQQAVVAPRDDSERVRVADSYEYGVSLQATNTSSQTDLMTQLVHDYGLVIAVPFYRERGSKKRYFVDPAMQLLAMFMMGISPEIDLLESSSFGYEVLSTHLVKCSIASTLAIQEDVRPSIQAALKKIGFGLNKPHGSISSEDDFTDYALWTSLDDMIAAQAEYQSQYRETTQHRQEMARQEKVTAEKFPVLQSKRFVPRDVDGGSFLFVDRGLIDAILGMKLCPSADGFWPPLASVAKGSSPYADGYVNFFAKRRSTSPTMYTIMVQAKDYFSSTKIDGKKLQRDLQRCRTKEISAAFGTSRLMCVASRYDKMAVVAKRSYTYLRDFIMFSTDKSKLLSDLMDTLDTQRNRASVQDYTGGIPIKKQKNRKEKKRWSRKGKRK